MFNITLVIQGANFLIAYFILAKFFFKPILADINQSNDENLFLHNLIKKYRSHLNDSLVRRDELWKKLRKKVKTCTAFCKEIDSQSHALDAGIKNIKTDSSCSLEKQKEIENFLIDKIVSSK